MSSESEGSPEPYQNVSVTRSEESFEEDGDLEILSSDGILFRIHAYRFQASSSVFRDMIKIGTSGPQRLELTDRDLETGAVITGLLDIMTKFKHLLDIKREERTSVLKFAQKYDFATELHLIKQQLNNGLLNRADMKRDPFNVLTMASLMDDHELCTHAIQTAGARWRWPKGTAPGEETQFGLAIKEGHLFDLANAPLVLFKQLPIEIIWALLRVSHKPTKLSGTELQAEYDARAEKFSKLMKLKGAPRFA